MNFVDLSGNRFVVDISEAKGEDSGLIVCKHVLLDHTTYEAQEEFKVLGK